jgi:hypothetical protein
MVLYGFRRALNENESQKCCALVRWPDLVSSSIVFNCGMFVLIAGHNIVKCNYDYVNDYRDNNIRNYYCSTTWCQWNNCRHKW